MKFKILIFLVKYLLHYIIVQYSHIICCYTFIYLCPKWLFFFFFFKNLGVRLFISLRNLFLRTRDALNLETLKVKIMLLTKNFLYVLLVVFQTKTNQKVIGKQ